MNKYLSVALLTIPALAQAAPEDIGKCKSAAAAISFGLDDLVDFVGDVVGEAVETVKNTAGDVTRTATTAVGATVEATVKAGGDTVIAVVKAGDNASATYVKAWKDSSAQTQRSFNDLVDAGTAVKNFGLNQLRAQLDVAERNAQRLRDGKVLDAMWGNSVEQLQASEANFAKATQESSLIAAAASSAATTYGGPGGAAAYAAWSTYRATGNAEQAFRAGLMAAAVSQAGGGVAEMPDGTMGEVLRKSAMAGAAGGIAMAAAGGDEEAIVNAFLKSSGAVIVQASNDEATAFSPNMNDAWKSAQCISARDVECLSQTTWVKDAKGRILADAKGEPLIDPKLIDPEEYIGKWSRIDPNSPAGKANAFVTSVSKLPKSGAIPLLKNRWVLTWTAGSCTGFGLGQPTVVLTYMGPKPPFTFDVRYGTDGRPVTPLASKSLPQAYFCSLGRIDRTIKVKKLSRGCDATYSRSDGIRQTVYHSDHFPNICAEEAAKFVIGLKSKGIKCTAQ